MITMQKNRWSPKTSAFSQVCFPLLGYKGCHPINERNAILTLTVSKNAIQTNLKNITISGRKQSETALQLVSSIKNPFGQELYFSRPHRSGIFVHYILPSLFSILDDYWKFGSFAHIKYDPGKIKPTDLHLT